MNSRRYSGMVIFAGNAGNPLSEKVCKQLCSDPAKAEVSRFTDSEINIQLLENVRDCDTFIINPTNPPAENLLEMVFLADAARRSSAGRITLVIPYLGYNRQDRKDRPRVPISAKVIAEILSLSGAGRVLVFDLHSEPTMGFFTNNIVVDHLYGSFVSIPYLKDILGDNFVVASPDKGGGPRAEAYANRLGLGDYVLFSKSRPKPNEISKGLIKIIGEVDGKDVLFVDDMIDTGGTIIADTEAAKNAGARNIYVFATHAVLSKGAVERLDKSPIKEVIVTDTIHHDPKEFETEKVKFTVLSVASLLAEAIRRIHNGESLSSLFY